MTTAEGENAAPTERGEPLISYDNHPDFQRPHSERGRCPLGDECPCWQEGWRDAMAVAEGRVVFAQQPSKRTEHVGRVTRIGRTHGDNA